MPADTPSDSNASAPARTDEGLLDGRVIVVTGGGRGIGRAEALRCARAGARVVVVDKGCSVTGEGADPAVAEAVAAEIRSAGGHALACAEDIGQGAGPERILRAALSFGRLDAVISAAGIAVEERLLHFDDRLLDRTLDTHVRGSFALLRAAGRQFIKQKSGGSVVLHAGPNAYLGAAKQTMPAVAAAATVALTRSAALELRKHGVRVNAIVPTALTRATEALPLFKGVAPEAMSPDYVASVALFLVSDLSREVTGEIVGVAGTRLYAFQSLETPGDFSVGEPPTAAGVAARWSEAMRA